MEVIIFQGLRNGISRAFNKKFKKWQRQKGSHGGWMKRKKQQGRRRKINIKSHIDMILKIEKETNVLHLAASSSKDSQIHSTWGQSYKC